MKNKKALFVTYTAVIAALYTVLSYLTDIFGLNFGAVQLRLSEVLTVLPLVTPAAIPGLTIGCVIANIASPFGIADVICGSVSTFISAVLTHCLRRIKIKDFPLLSVFPPVIVNAVIIGAQISIINGGGYTMFMLTFLQIAAGQGIVCFALGIPFYYSIKKINIFTTNRF